MGAPYKHAISSTMLVSSDYPRIAHTKDFLEIRNVSNIGMLILITQYSHEIASLEGVLLQSRHIVCAHARMFSGRPHSSFKTKTYNTIFPTA